MVESTCLGLKQGGHRSNWYQICLFFFFEQNKEKRSVLLITKKQGFQKCFSIKITECIASIAQKPINTSTSPGQKAYRTHSKRNFDSFFQEMTSNYSR